MLGIRLAIWQIPPSGGRFFLLRLAAFILGISTIVHLATTLLRLKSWWRWLFAAVAPTAVIVGWYVYGVEYGHHHPGSIGVYGLLAGGLFWFPIGYTVIHCLVVTINRIQDAFCRAKDD